MSDTKTANLEAHDQLIALGKRFVVWRYEYPPNVKRDALPTKVPYQAKQYSGGKASSNDAATWHSYDAAMAELARWSTLPDGTREYWYNGLMVGLGDCGGGRYLAGIDLDSCITPDGSVAAWVDPYLDILRETYVEVSPSRTGAKAFFFLAADDVDRVRAAFGIRPTEWGRKVAIGATTGPHAPAVELYTAVRFFTVTRDHWRGESTERIATFDLATMQRLAELLPTKQRTNEGGSGGDTTRSATATATAMAIGMRLRRAGASYETFCEAVRDDPRTADWYHEKGVTNNERELQRIWQKPSQRKAAPPPNGVRLWQPAREVMPLTADGYVDEARLPKRQWVGEILPPKGKVMLLSGPGGVGKSTVATVLGVSVAHHRELLDLWIAEGDHGVVIALLEDDELDLHKSVAACLKHYKLRMPSRLQLYGKRDEDDDTGLGPLVIARRDEDGSVMVEPVVEQMIAKLRADRTGLLIMDAFGFTHLLDENDNGQMRHVMGLWNYVARQANCVIVLLHHFNKGAGTGIERSRGAIAITDHSRGGWTLTCGLTADDARRYQLPDHHDSYVRLDDPKRNFTKKQADAIWFHIIEVHLDNGDRVGQGVAVRWYPPVPKTEPFTDELADAVTHGLGNGEYYTKDMKSKDRWFGNAVMELKGVDAKEAGKLIGRWIKDDELKEESYRSPTRRIMQQRLVYVAKG